MSECVIVDIDGTLADCNHRRRFINKRPKDWDKFFDPNLLAKDPLIQPVAKLVNILSTSHTIIYVTARPDKLREATIDWLSEHELWIHPFELYMRRDGDRRPDVVVKKEILYELKKDGWDPWLCLDDRNAVVAMWRREGVTCLQVADGDF